MALFLLLNGPNLNLLGTREPDIYGANSLADIERHLGERARSLGHRLDCFQANSESALIERIHAAKRANVGCIIFNPAAFTHTSIALRDALLATGIAFVEVHLSNVAAREAFRAHSYFADIATGTITGFGAFGYDLALDAAVRHATLLARNSP